MARTELPWLFLGRKVRPYSFAVSFATAILSLTILTGSSVWGDEHDTWSLIAASLAGLSTVLLWAGFWMPSSALMQHGLILSAVVFAVRGTYIGLVGENWWTAVLSYAWTVASGGAWLLERTTGDEVLAFVDPMNGRGGEGE